MKGMPTEVCKLLEKNVEAYFAGGYRVVRKDVRFGKRMEGLWRWKVHGVGEDI